MPSGAAPVPIRRLGIEVQGRVDDYLLRVDGALTREGASAAERRTLGISLRKQIMQKLSARAGVGGKGPSVADADAVLAEMGTPESHLNDPVAPAPAPAIAPAVNTPVAEGAKPHAGTVATTKRQSVLSMTAVIGAIWALIFPIMLLLSTVKIEVAPGQSPPLWQKAAQLTVVPIGWAAPFATTVLGLLALGRIQKSDGHLRGLSLALFDSLLFPLLLSDALLFWLWWQVTDAMFPPDAMTAAVAKLINQAMPTVAVVLGDYFVVIKAWGAVQPKVRRRR